MNPTDPTVADRLENLEVKVAFQDNLLAELDEVITTMRDELERLRAQVASLSEDANQQELGDLPGEKPPHYGG